MGRIARVVFPGCPYQVTHRGQRREPVFFGAEDRRHYLRFLRMYAQRSAMRIWCYCLMSNHVHANTSIGRPSGSPEFVRLLEWRVGRVARPSTRGPKPKEENPRVSYSVPETPKEAKP